MKIGKWHIDYQDGQYWVYCKKSLDKRTKKEFPTETSYFNTLAGALKCVRHELIGSKIGRDKLDDLSVVLAQIVSIDKYVVECLEKMPNEQKVGAYRAKLYRD